MISHDMILNDQWVDDDPLWLNVKEGWGLWLWVMKLIEVIKMYWHFDDGSSLMSFLYVLETTFIWD